MSVVYAHDKDLIYAQKAKSGWQYETMVTTKKGAGESCLFLSAKSGNMEAFSRQDGNIMYIYKNCYGEWESKEIDDGLHDPSGCIESVVIDGNQCAVYKSNKQVKYAILKKSMPFK